MYKTKLSNTENHNFVSREDKQMPSLLIVKLPTLSKHLLMLTGKDNYTMETV